MLRISVVYRLNESSRFDMAYYIGQHADLVRKLYVPLGLKRFEVDHDWQNNVVSGHLLFPASPSLLEDLGRVSAALAADAPNYTDVTSTMTVATIVAPISEP